MKVKVKKNSCRLGEEGGEIINSSRRIMGFRIRLLVRNLFLGGEGLGKIEFIII